MKRTSLQLSLAIFSARVKEWIQTILVILAATRSCCTLLWHHSPIFYLGCSQWSISSLLLASENWSSTCKNSAPFCTRDRNEKLPSFKSVIHHQVPLAHRLVVCYPLLHKLPRRRSTSYIKSFQVYIISYTICNNNMWPAMRKGTIHGSMKHDHSWQWPTCFLQMYTVVSILVSVYRHQQSGYTYTVHYYCRLYTLTSYILQTQSPKWSLFSQLVTYYCVHRYSF